MLRVRTILNTTVGGGPYLNTLYFIGADNQAGADDANAAVGAFWGAVDAIMADSITWSTDSEVAQVDAASGNITAFYAVTPVTGSGGLSSEELPPATQALVRWRTSGIVNGRRLQGRTFVPGMTESANNNGRLHPADQAVLLTAANTLIADSADLAIWSETNSVAHNVVTATVWNEFAQLRKRRD